MDRRTAIGLIGTALTVGIAGCADGSAPRTDRPTDTQSSTRTQTTTSTEQPTERPTERQPDTATETNTPEDSPTAEPTQSETSTETPRQTTAVPEPDYTITVGPNGLPGFNPPELVLEAGETVEWVWESDGHNVRPDDIPDDSDWTGTKYGDGWSFDAGHIHQHTFTATGDYSYYCAHDEPLATGSLTVQ